MAEKLLVTPRSLTRGANAAVERLTDAGYQVVTCTAGARPSEDELLRLLPGCVGYLAGVETISERVLSAADRLRVISRNGVGTDAIDIAAAKRKGIKILTTPGANSEGVAELAIGLLFALARGIPRSDATLKAGQWARVSGRELQGTTLGVVGCGSIGRRVAEIALGIGMDVVGHDPSPAEDFGPRGFRWVALEELWSVSNAITLHAPSPGRPIVDAEVLLRIKPGALLVNTARAALIDADGVISALDTGVLGGYATDVFDEEPPTDSRLVAHPNVIATPHIGGYTSESIQRASVGAAENLLAILKGS